MSDAKIDAVGLVRQIRDRIYDETKDMSAEELIAYYQRHSAKARETLAQPQSREEMITRGETP